MLVNSVYDCIKLSNTLIEDSNNFKMNNEVIYGAIENLEQATKEFSKVNENYCIGQKKFEDAFSNMTNAYLNLEYKISEYIPMYEEIYRWRRLVRLYSRIIYNMSAKSPVLLLRLSSRELLGISKLSRESTCLGFYMTDEDKAIFNSCKEVVDSYEH